MSGNSRATRPIARYEWTRWSQMTLPEPKRLRDWQHLRFVANQPCLVCGRDAGAVDCGTSFLSNSLHWDMNLLTDLRHRTDCL